MKLKPFLLISGLAALLLFSCDSSSLRYFYQGPGGGIDNKFFAQDMTTGNFYTLLADPIYDEGKYCEVWAERGSNVSITTAQKVADQFDEEIYAKLEPVFGFKSAILDGEPINRDTLSFANWFCAKDSDKIIILILNIKDGNNSNVYTAGYFSPLDFLGYDPSYYNETWFSNECPMLYINAKMLNDLDDLYTTIAHETQHLMSFTADLAIRSNWSVTDSGARLTKINQQDVWINEGLSAAAEYIYSGDYSPERVGWFCSDPRKSMTQGNNFYVWGNYSSDPYTILDDYATVYFFFQWLRIEAGGDEQIYNKIIKSKKLDVDAVVDATAYSNWGPLLRDWMADNYLSSEDPSGFYGEIEPKYLSYEDDDGDEITVERIFFLDWLFDIWEENRTEWSLAPGEGVYTKSEDWPKPPPSNAPNVRHAGLKAGSAISESATLVTGYDDYDSGALLSYNINKTKTAGRETCYPLGQIVTGQNGSVSGSQPVPRSMAPWQTGSVPGGPYKISAADMLRINGNRADASGHNLPNISRELSIGE